MMEYAATFLRSRARDAARARDYLAGREEAVVQELLAEAGYDDFIPHVTDIGEPSIALGTATDSAGEPIEVRMSVAEFATHALILGSTGSGKSSFATWLFASALRAGSPVGLCDCKNGFFEQGIQWAGVMAAGLPVDERPSFIRRLAVVNPFGETLPPLNVCRLAPGATLEMQAYDVSSILGKLFDSTQGVQMQTLVQHTVQLLIEHSLSLVEAPLVLQDPLVRGVLVARSQQIPLKEYFHRYDSIPSSSREAVITRLQALLLPEPIRLALGADECVDFKAIFDAGDPLIMFLGMGARIPAELVDLVGSLVLSLLFDGAKAGSLRTRRPYVLLADEYFHLLDVPLLARRFERGLDTFRAFGLQLATVLHRLSQVPRTLQEALLQHAAMIVTFRTASRDAQAFADLLPEVDPDLLRMSLRRHGRAPARHEMRAQLLEQLGRLPDRTCYLVDRRKPYRALRVRVPDVPEPHVAVGMSRRQFEEFIEAHDIARGGLALPKAELRRQIDERAARLRTMMNPPIVVTKPEAEPAAPTPPAGNQSRRPRLG